MIYFTSDLHFFHDREFIWGARGFKSVEEMNEAYVAEWQSKITDSDEIYVLGDFAMGGDLEKIEDLLYCLPGFIHLIIGNHDSPKKLDLYECKHIDVQLAAMIRYHKHNFYLSHYPTITANLGDNEQTCLINLHGHTHSKKQFYDDKPYMINVGVDANMNHFLTIEDVHKMYHSEVEKCKLFI